MHQCPYCQSAERQVKSGFNRTGSQRFQCQSCRRQYTPEPNPLGYDDKTREAALRLYLEGNGLRRIGRLLSVNHQTVANWVTAAHARLPAGAPAPEEAGTLEMDELFTFVGAKKSPRISSRSSKESRAASSRTKSVGSGRRR